MTARAIHHGLGLIFPCNNRKKEVNKWYLLLGDRPYKQTNPGRNKSETRRHHKSQPVEEHILCASMVQAAG